MRHSTWSRSGRPLLIILAFLIGLPALLHGATRRVPADYPSIQAGVDAAEAGDIVLVADGVYRGRDNINLDFRGKPITVMSEHGRDRCIIDCEREGIGADFSMGEGKYSILQGFTITNGLADD